MWLKNITKEFQSICGICTSCKEINNHRSKQNGKNDVIQCTKAYHAEKRLPIAPNIAISPQRHYRLAYARKAFYTLRVFCALRAFMHWGFKMHWGCYCVESFSCGVLSLVDTKTSNVVYSGKQYIRPFTLLVTNCFAYLGLGYTAHSSIFVYVQVQLLQWLHVCTLKGKLLNYNKL